MLADRVAAEHPDWSDEDIFQRARRLVISSMQNIILYEYLPTLFDEPIPEYNGYKPDIHPGISHVFQSAAFRFGHTMIPPGLYRRYFWRTKYFQVSQFSQFCRDANCNFLKTPSGHDGIRLCASWWDAVEILPNAGLEEMLMGLTSQIAEREDAVLCSDVRGKLNHISLSCRASSQRGQHNTTQYDLLVSSRSRCLCLFSHDIVHVIVVVVVVVADSSHKVCLVSYLSLSLVQLFVRPPSHSSHNRVHASLCLSEFKDPSSSYSSLGTLVFKLFLSSAGSVSVFVDFVRQRLREAKR